MEKSYFAECITVLKDRMRLIIWGVLWCVVIATAVSLLMPKIYRAKAMVCLFSPIAKTDFTPAIVAMNADQGGGERQEFSRFSGAIEDDEFKDASIYILQNMANSPEVLRCLEDTMPPGKDISIEYMDKKMLTAEILSGQRNIYERFFLPCLNLVVDARDKRLARDLANAWAQIVTEKYNTFVQYRFKYAYKSILKELKISKDMLLAKENALREFQKVTTEKEAGKDTAQERQYRLIQLKREVEMAKMDYELLERKKTQFKMAYIERPVFAMTIVNAVEPQRHIQPQRTSIVLSAGFIGLLGMVAWVLCSAPYKK